MTGPEVRVSGRYRRGRRDQWRPALNPHWVAFRDGASSRQGGEAQTNRNDRGAGFERQARRAVATAQKPQRVAIDGSLREHADRAPGDEMRPRLLQGRNPLGEERLYEVEKARPGGLAGDRDRASPPVEDVDARDHAKIPVGHEVNASSVP